MEAEKMDTHQNILSLGTGWPFFFISALLWGFVEGAALHVAKSGNVGIEVKLLAGAVIVIAAAVYVWGLFQSPGNLGLIAMVWDTVAFIGGVIGYNVSDLAKVFNIADPKVWAGWLVVLIGGALLIVGWNLLESL